MNPLALLLLAAAAGGRRMPGPSHGNVALNMDTLLSQLHGAVNTLEKVSELSHIGTNLSGPVFTGSVPRQVPSSAHIPAPAPTPASFPEDETSPLPPEPSASAPQLPNIDLQSAMQTLGPLISMLSGNQNSK